MRVISRKGEAATAAKRWSDTYSSGKYGDDKLLILDKLEALGPNPHPDDVDAVIGNKSWTNCYCDECQTAYEQVIEVGQEPTYDSSTARLCKDCALKAATTMIIAEMPN